MTLTINNRDGSRTVIPRRIPLRDRVAIQRLNEQRNREGKAPLKGTESLPQLPLPQEPPTEQEKLRVAQQTIASLNASAERSGSNQRFYLTQDQSTGEYEIGKKQLPPLQRSVAQNTGGLNQIPGLQTQTVIQNATQQPTVVSEKRFQQTGFFARVAQGQPDTAISEAANSNNPLKSVPAYAFLRAEENVLLAGNKSLEFGNYLQGEHPLAKALYNDPTKIFPGAKTAYDNPDKLPGKALNLTKNKLDKAYGISGDILISAGASAIQNPARSAGEVAADLLFFEAGSRLLTAEEPLIATSLKTQSKIIQNTKTPITLELSKTEGTIITKNVLGVEREFDVQAQTFGSTFKATNPSKRAPGVAFTEQNTVLQLTDGQASFKGALKADVATITAGKKSVSQGDFLASVGTGKKVIDVEGQLKTFNQPAKSVIELAKPRNAFYDVEQIINPQQIVTKGNTAIAEIAVSDKKIIKSLALPTADDVSLKLEVSKYFKGLDNKPAPKITQALAVESFPVAKIGKTENLVETTSFNAQIKGDNFVVNEQSSIATELGTAETVQKFSTSIGKGGTYGKEIDFRIGKPIDVKGFEAIDLNSLLKLKENTVYTIVEGEKVTRGNIAGQGVKSNLFSGKIESFGNGVAKLQKAKAPKVAIKTESLTQAGVTAASTEAVKTIIKAENKAIGSKVSLSAATLSTFGRGAPIALAAPTYQEKETPTIDFGSKALGTDKTDSGTKSFLEIKPGEKFRLNGKNRYGQSPIPDTKIDVERKPSIGINFGAGIKNIQKAGQDVERIAEKVPQQDLAAKLKQRSKSQQDNIPSITLPPPKYKFGFPTTTLGSAKSRGLYHVTVGAPGNKNFFDLGIGGEDLVKRARAISKNTAAARVNVTTIGTGNPANIGNLLGNDFTKSKAGNYYIEKQGRRITTGGEKREIPGASRGRLSQGRNYSRVQKLTKKGYNLRQARTTLKRLKFL